MEHYYLAQKSVTNTEKRQLIKEEKPYGEILSVSAAKVYKDFKALNWP